MDNLLIFEKLIVSGDRHHFCTFRKGRKTDGVFQSSLLQNSFSSSHTALGLTASCSASASFSAK